MSVENDPLAEAKAELQRLKEDLTSRLESMGNPEDRPKMDASVGRLTFMDEMQQHEMAEAGRRNMEAKLADVHDALARVDAGTYGKCIRCDADIMPEQLEYMPETSHCVNCQR